MSDIKLSVDDDIEIISSEETCTDIHNICSNDDKEHKHTDNDDEEHDEQEHNSNDEQEPGDDNDEEHVKLSKEVLSLIDNLPVDDKKKEYTKSISSQLAIDFKFRLPYMFQIYLNEDIQEFSDNISEDTDLFYPIADRITFDILKIHLG